MCLENRPHREMRDRRINPLMNCNNGLWGYFVCRTFSVMACPEYSRVLTDTDEAARYRTTPNTVTQRLAALRFLYS
jgi:hypothetical protein